MSENKNTKRLLRKRKKKTQSAFTIPKATVIYANINGRQESPTRIVGSSLDNLLNNCTQILRLSSAARKLYLADGTLVQSTGQLRKSPEVFVSQGEPFIDTVKLMKESLLRRDSSFWGLNGVYLSKPKSKSPTRKKEAEQTMRRVLTFKNGKYLLDDAFEVISDLKSVEEFKSLCDAKHNLNGHCKRLFSANGSEIKDLNALLQEESYVWSLRGESAVLGPVWASTNEDLDRSSLDQYLHLISETINGLLRKEKKHLAELSAMSNGDIDNVHTSSIKSYSKKELEVRKNESEERLKKLKSDSEKFRARLQSAYDVSTEAPHKQPTQSDNDTFRSIPGLQLRVFTNGHPSTEKVNFFFNVEQAKKGINDAQLLFNRLLDDLSMNIHLTKSNDHSKGILIKRLFAEDGNEIFEVSSLKYGQTVCVSHGENWIDTRRFCLSGKIHSMDQDLNETSAEVDKMKNYALSKKMVEKDLLYNLPVLQNKKKSSSYVMVSVSVLERNPMNVITENWSFTKSGRIFMTRIPTLSLTLLQEGGSTLKLPEIISRHRDRSTPYSVTCYSVQLCPSEPDNLHQLWTFTELGYFSSKANPALHLTYKPMKEIVSHDFFFNIVMDSNICACELLPQPLVGNQRWGFKHPDQRKSCDIPNSEWYKAGFIWPLLKDGSLNDDLEWPLTGVLVVRAPPANRFYVDSKIRFPIKLNVFKNDDHFNRKAILVTGPDLTKLVKDSREDKYGTHCSNESLLKMEFEMFLANCTSSLCLPSAARRLFNKDGKELNTLEGLSNFDYVFISMGSMWSSPENSLSKIQLRIYANKLAIDVERLRNFMLLLQPGAELVLGIKDSALEESVIEVQELSEQSRKEVQRIQNEDNHIPVVEVPMERSEDEDSRHRTCHEKNCDAAKRRFVRRDGEAQTASITPATGTAKYGHSQSSPASNLQQFIVEKNHIVASSDRRFCLCDNGAGGYVTFKKIPPSTDLSQYKWIVHESRMIESKHHRGFVLAASCPKMLPFQDKSNESLSGVLVTLEKAVNTKYGKASQRFNIESRTGLIYPFCANQLDLGVTSAINSSICTSFVISKPINQQGFLVDMKKERSSGDKTEPICVSCASILSGRFPSTPIDDCRRTFVCSYAGGFKVIRVADLSPKKAEETYQFYVAKLQAIREQLRIKPCKNRITSAPMKMIKILLYKNGCGRKNPPQVATGKSILQIIEAASYLLNLQRPVRILYTESGVAVTDELSFVNAMADFAVEVPAEKTPKLDEMPDEELQDSVVDEDEGSLDITLSSDSTYFSVASRKSPPMSLYLIEICIRSIVGVAEFCDESRMPNSRFLINFEVFNNQINSDLFRDDSDFESEVTDLTVKSSPRMLARLFKEDLKLLRMQLLAVSLENPSDGTDDVRLDIKSIDAVTEVDLKKIAKKLLHINTTNITETFLCPLISADTSDPTRATLTVEISVKMLGEKSDERMDDLDSTNSDSIIKQPLSNTKLVELWASMGEPFHRHLEDGSKSGRGKKLDQLKSDISNKKFLLRNIKGKRLKQLNAGTMEATGDGKNPVKIKGNWMFPPREERELEDQIKVLEEKLEKKKVPTHTANGSLVSRPLYNQKHMRNCLVYLNGDSENNAVSAWGETIYDLMQSAAVLLQMKKTPKFLFRINGEQVKSIEEVTPGLKLAMSHHATFISAQDTKLQYEIKANWGRARSKHGEQSTELQIQHRPITVIDVDPFDPPDIMKPRESISKDAKTFKVFENGQLPSGASTISGNSLTGLLREAAKVLGLAAAVKCFYTLDGKRIVSFKEILNDDVLVASVAARGFIKSDDA